MVENGHNPDGEFLSKKAHTAWQRAERQAGVQFLAQLKDPTYDKFAACFTFYRTRDTLAKSQIINPEDLEQVRRRTLWDMSNIASYKNSLNDANRTAGEKLVAVEAQRIAKMLEPKKRTVRAAVPHLN